MTASAADDRSPFRVRAAEPRDAVVAAEVLVRSIREVCADDYADEQQAIAAWCADKTPDRVREWLRDRALHTVVAEGLGDVVGVGQLDRSSGEIRLCYVAPEMVGLGVGSALMEALEAEAGRSGLDRLTLNSTFTAHDFYRALGYEETGEPAPCGEGLPDGVPMAKELPG